MLIRILILSIVLLINAPVYAYMECVVNTDCYFLYVPRKISDGYSRDATLTIASPSDDIDIFWFYEDGLSVTEVIEANQTDTCPPVASQACLTHLGNGVYKVGIDATLNNASGKRLCIDVRDVQATRTVSDELLCNYIYVQDRLIDSDTIGINLNNIIQATGLTTLTNITVPTVTSVTNGVTLAADAIDATKIAAGAIGNDEFNVTKRYWPVYNVIDQTNESGDQNPATTSFDTDFVSALNIAAAIEPIIYFPTLNEEPMQDAACNMMEIATKVTAYNWTTKVVTVDALPQAPDYRCKFWRY